MQKNKTVQFPKVKGRTQINFIRNPSFKNTLHFFHLSKETKKIYRNTIARKYRVFHDSNSRTTRITHTQPHTKSTTGAHCEGVSSNSISPTIKTLNGFVQSQDLPNHELKLNTLRCFTLSQISLSHPFVQFFFIRRI